MRVYKDPSQIFIEPQKNRIKSLSGVSMKMMELIMSKAHQNIDHYRQRAEAMARGFLTNDRSWTQSTKGKAMEVFISVRKASDEQILRWMHPHYAMFERELARRKGDRKGERG